MKKIKGSYLFNHAESKETKKGLLVDSSCWNKALMSNVILCWRYNEIWIVCISICNLSKYSELNDWISNQLRMTEWTFFSIYFIYFFKHPVIAFGTYYFANFHFKDHSKQLSIENNFPTIYTTFLVHFLQSILSFVCFYFFMAIYFQEHFV